jgi:phage tail-like protein
VSVDFAALLYASLPGVYRDKDTAGELRHFLEVAAEPLAELHASIGQLYEDLFIEDCRAELIPLIGGLVGVEVDLTLPARAQRAQVADAIRFYRAKGLREPLERFAHDLTGWPVTLVDFSANVAQAPFVETLNPVLLLRDQPVGEAPSGSGRFFARVDLALQPLFDALTGRPITRAALAGREAEYAGIEGRFTIEERGDDLFEPSAGTPYEALAADLSDFATPLTPGGAALVLGARQVAVDPELGRFLIASPLPQAGNLRVTYSALHPASIPTQAFDISRPARMTRLGRADDPAPYTADLRAPRHVSDRIGQKHYDNHGFFFSPGRIVTNQRPNTLPPDSESERFSFDNRPLTVADSRTGVTLQLMDGFDGAPLTRAKLAGEELEFCSTPRGFTIRIRGLSITDPAFRPQLTVRAADLSDFSNPTIPGGGAMTLAPTDVAIDPQLGRFILDLAAIDAKAEEVRVDYLLASAVRIEDAAPFAFGLIAPEAFAFAGDGTVSTLRDAFDGTPVAVALRLGRTMAAYHGSARGWRILHNDIDLSATLLAELRSLDNVTTPVAPGLIAIDLERGRFKLPPGLLAPGDVIRVSFAAEDVSAQAERFASFAQQIPRGLPAGVVPVIIDTRSRPKNPLTLS